MGNTNLAKYKKSSDPRDHPEDFFDFIAYPIVPVCKDYMDFKPTIAMMWPLSNQDKFGNDVFTAPSGNEPFDAPANYGVLIKNAPQGNRETYFSPYDRNEWFLPVEYPVACIETYSDPACVASVGVITVQNINYYPILSSTIPLNGGIQMAFETSMLYLELPTSSCLQTGAASVRFPNSPALAARW